MLKNHNNNFNCDLEYALAFLILLFVAFLSYVRIYFGVDFTDESLYSAIPYSFILGNRPYIDEISPIQNTGILLTPLYKIYIAVIGSSDGIILFNRHLYFFLLCLNVFLVYLLTSKYIESPIALLLGALMLLINYSGIQAISYNTLGILGLLAGCLLLFLGEFGKLAHPIAPQALSFLGVLWLFVSAFAYPTLVLTIGITILLYFYHYFYEYKFNKKIPKSAYGLLSGSLLSLIFGLYFLFQIGTTNLFRVWEYSKSMGYGLSLSYKFHEIYSQVKNQLPYYLATCLIAMIIPFIKLKKTALNKTGLFLAMAAIYLWLAPTGKIEFNSILFNICLFLSCAVIYFIILEKKRYSKIMIFIWIPTFFLGLSFLYSSDNLIYAGGCLFQGMILGLFLWIAAFSGDLLVKTDRVSKYFGLRKVSIYLVLVVFLALNIFSLYKHIYRDSPIRELKAHITSGPFAGLWTTPVKRDFLLSISKEIAKVAKDKKGVLFYDAFPAGYLLSDLRPRTPSVWLFWSENKEKNAVILENIFSNNEQDWPEVIIEITLKKDTIRPRRYNPIPDFLRKSNKYTLQTRRQYFNIFCKNRS